MTGGDYASWRDCWHATAERIERIADEAATAGRRRSAGEAYLRASEYYRASYFFDRADLTGSFLLSAWEATRRAFRAGLDHIDLDVDLVSVPYADTTLTGYLFRPQQAAAGPYPTVVTVAGYDSPIEEYYAFNVVGGTKRGYAVLMVDGPGQGSALYEKAWYSATTMNPSSVRSSTLPSSGRRSTKSGLRCPGGASAATSRRGQPASNGAPAQ